MMDGMAPVSYSSETFNSFARENIGEVLDACFALITSKSVACARSSVAKVNRTTGKEAGAKVARFVGPQLCGARVAQC